MTITGNNYDASTDYDWSQMFSATPLPIEEEPAPAVNKTVTNTATKEVATTEAATFELKSTSIDNLTTASTNLAFNNAFQQTNFIRPLWQTEQPTFDVNILPEPQPTMPFLCEKSALAAPHFSTSTTETAPFFERSKYFTTGNLSTTNSYWSPRQNFNFTFSSNFSSSFFPGLNFSFTPSNSLSFGLNNITFKAGEEISSPSLISTTSSYDETSVTEEETKKAKNNASQITNLVQMITHLKESNIDKDTISLITKVYNSLSSSKQEAMLNELTTTGFSAQLTKQKIELKAIARHYAQASIADNIAKGKGAIEDARSVIF